MWPLPLGELGAQASIFLQTCCTLIRPSQLPSRLPSARLSSDVKLPVQSRGNKEVFGVRHCMHVHAEGFKPSHSQMLPLCCSGGLGCATHPLHPTNQGVSAAVGVSGCSSDPARWVVCSSLCGCWMSASQSCHLELLSWVNSVPLPSGVTQVPSVFKTLQAG